jgi:hypothetical protein
MISTYTKDFIFHEENDPNSPDYEELFFKSPDFYDKFQQVAKNIKGFCFFFVLLSYLLYNQIWLNYFLNDRHFGYITKSLKKRAMSPSINLKGWTVQSKRLFKSHHLG